MSFSSKIRYALQAAWEMIYPRLCLHCQQETAVKSHMFCMHCLHDYVETDYHLVVDNPVALHFYGRVPIERAASLLDFKKGTLSQTLLHELKYNHRQEIGTALGARFAKKVKPSGFFEGMDLIIPVPLHPKKLRQRGYNQSMLFAKGIQEHSDLPVWGNILVRKVHTGTQTRKKRMERIDNVAEAFHLKDPDQIQRKHILLVDDVVTTGATLEACAAKLLAIKGTKVSVATIALG